MADAETAAAWGPDWFPLPTGKQLYRTDARPCECGGTIFRVSTYLWTSRDGNSDRRTMVACQRCVKLDRTERQYLLIDVSTWPPTVIDETKAREGVR